jgi:DNA-binding GntR family transcriptional regulator
MAIAPDEHRVDDNEALSAIAGSVRGSFQTVEDMTQSFIREAISQGIFLPGTRLNLNTIAATLGVSRMPVRASLRQLESEGLLTIHPYRGATVSILGAKEIKEIYELRMILESYLLRHAIPNLTEKVLGELRVIVEQLEESIEPGHRLDLRYSFYETLYNCADRPRAMAQASNLRTAVGRYLLLQRADDNHAHAEFFGYLVAQDSENAQVWLSSHLMHVSEKLQNLVAPA